MGERDTTRRILDQLGEDETLLSTDYTAADLKLFGPAFLLVILVVGVMPPGWGILGFALGALVLIGTAGLIWKAPPHRVAYDWLTDVVAFRYKKFRGKTLMLPHDSDDDSDTRTLTNVDTVLRRWNSVKRTDGGLVGAMRVHPANMALGDESDWETAADALAGFLRSISFDVQIYSTARPVDASQIVGPYRDRLDDPDVRDNDRLRGVIRAYRDKLPKEFERRRTSVREYYIIISVREMDVKLANQGWLDTLRDAPYVGTIFEFIGSGRSDLSDGEVLVRQQRELNRRLRSIRRGITGLPDCRPEEVSAARLTDLLEEYWTGEPSNYDEEGAGSIRNHELPIIRPDHEQDPTTGETDDATIDSLDSMTDSQQLATDGGTDRGA
ncbi:hypothetical protein [Halococcus thailandensis]|uniref:Conjugation protein n=1 Tax=Halococcus thailandensis JCM 13552 TaxID=1227457 RepID=M0NFY8_9EURY|nr:hypothetical protein [Halococcus thailandensis]EMA56463.1 hypothetical protein C451_02023 [Halococcus thailandensis JCM 13552]